ncbi:MAG: hypothetical protein PHG06_21540 [Parabacteroides sp.]|nr:hypothetical protein [Parabacteroides sp.]
MYVILSQKVDTESSYSDDLFNTYHYPARYMNQLHTDDVFIYYQGNRYDKEQRYYFGTGVIGNIHTTDRESYYADLIQCQRFTNKVPIYLPDGGYIEQKGYLSVRNRLNPPWQSSIRSLSKEAYDFIIRAAGGLSPEGQHDDIETLKNGLKNSVKDFYVGGNHKAILEIIDMAKRIARFLNLDVRENDETIDTHIPSMEKCLVKEDTYKNLLFDYCKSMRMSYSYKPVLILAVLEVGSNGYISIDSAVSYFRHFYTQRRKQGLKIEKGNCIYQRPDISDESIAVNIIANPVKALSSSGYLHYDKVNNVFGFRTDLWNVLSEDDKNLIRSVCHTKLEKYYSSKLYSSDSCSRCSL